MDDLVKCNFIYNKRNIRLTYENLSCLLRNPIQTLRKNTLKLLSSSSETINKPLIYTTHKNLTSLLKHSVGHCKQWFKRKEEQLKK